MHRKHLLAHTCSSSLNQDSSAAVTPVSCPAAMAASSEMIPACARHAQHESNKTALLHET